MSSDLPFILHFSGQGVFEQEKAAESLLRQLPADAHALRVRALATLTAARVFTDVRDARTAAADAAREADAADDEVSHAWALLAAGIADLSCEKTPQRLETTRQVLAIAQRHGESALAGPAYLLHLGALAEMCEITQLDQALSPASPLFSTFPHLARGRQVAWFRGLRATIDGNADLAEQLAAEAYADAQRRADPDAQAAWVGQLAIIRWMQGRVVELEPAFLQARQAAPHEPVWAVSLAWMWLRQGRRSAARALVASLPPVAELPRDRNWLATLCILSTVVAELREVEIAAELRDALAAFEGRLVTIGLGITCWGTVSRPLALLAQVLGDRAAAITHYRRAIETSARIGAHPWLAESQSELAALLSDGVRQDDAHSALGQADDPSGDALDPSGAALDPSGDAPDPSGDAPGPSAAALQEAAELASEAAATVRALQLHGIESAADAVLSAIVTPKERFSDRALNAPGAARPHITVLGDFDVRTREGAPARWQSRKARRLLKILVARRGVAIGRQTVMHMLWPDEAPQRVANRFSVAATTVRRALDPTGSRPSDAYLETGNGLVRLCVDELSIDIETFLTTATAALQTRGTAEARAARLRAALEQYAGEPLADEPEEPWAEQLRREVHITFFATAHALAEVSESFGDHLTRVEAYRRILAVDPYDQRAHEGHVDALTRLRSLGQVAIARGEYEQRMREMGVPATGR